MEEVRSKHRIAHNHRCNWQCWDRLPVVWEEEGILEFVDELFDDNTQIRLQGDNLAAELTMSSSMGKKTLSDWNFSNDTMPVSYFRLDYPMRRESDSLPAWYTLRVK